MKHLFCSAVIDDEGERRAILDWVSKVAYECHEVGTTIDLSYRELPSDQNPKLWALIHWFEKYPEHTIVLTEGGSHESQG